jgi:hypothetical protein
MQTAIMMNVEKEGGEQRHLLQVLSIIIKCW